MVALRRLLQALWPSIDPNDLQGSLPAFKASTAALIHQFAAASNAMSVREYQRQRVAAGIRSQFTPPVADPPPLEQIDSVLSWATSDLYRAEPDQLDEALRVVETKTAGAVEKMVADTGRRTVVEAVQADRMARGWAREVHSAHPCSFCLLLSTRGAVYKSQESAGGGDFKFHDHCDCIAVPVFGAYEMTAQSRAALDLYKSSTRGEKDKLNAFRRAVEASRRTETPAPGGPQQPQEG